MSLVYFDISIGGSPVGRMVFRLFDSVAPRTTLNFKSLCVGDHGIGKTTGKRLSYENTILHRVIPGFMCQGGDFSKRDGTGGESIFGGKFADEPFRVKHTKAGQLSMANAGPNTNGSQFFITFTSTPHLDGKHVVFGEIVEGMNILKKIETVEVGDRDRPTFGQEVCIQACGAIGEKSDDTAEKARKHSLEEAMENANRVAQESERVPDKRHKKEKKDKKDRKSSKKSSKKHKKKSSKKSSKKSKRWRSDSSSSSDDSSVGSTRSRSSSSSEEEVKHTDSRAKVAKVTQVKGAEGELHESANQDTGEAGEIVEDVEENFDKTKHDAPRDPPGKPARVDADGTVCRGRGNIKYRDNACSQRDQRNGSRGGNYRGEGREGSNNTDRNRVDHSRRGDRDGGAPARERYVPKERSYDREKSPDSPAERRGAQQDNRRRGEEAVPVEGKDTSVRGRMHSALSSGRDKDSGNGKRRDRDANPAGEDKAQDWKRARADVVDNSD